jgi:hypothetical protein
MRYLLFVSLCFVLFAGCNPKIVPVSGFKSDHHFWTPQLRDSAQRNNYRITISRGEMNISGIWLVRQIDKSWRGRMGNEFGMQLFDFICTAKKCELKNVNVFANKWYIRKTIAADVQFILEIDNPTYKKGRTAHRSWNNDTLTISNKNKTLQRFATGEMVMYNKKRGLTYSFKKMEE